MRSVPVHYGGPEAMGKVLQAEEAVRTLLRLVHPHPEAHGVLDTPGRVVRALLEMTEGYHEDPASIMATTFDAEGYDQIVVLRGIQFDSLCEHHLLPFRGEASLAYIPDLRVVGLSKMARLVDALSRRLQIQERLTFELCDNLDKHLKPVGAAAVVRAEHLCMCARGVRKPGAVMVTSDVRGVFREDAAARGEVMRLLGL